MNGRHGGAHYEHRKGNHEMYVCVYVLEMGPDPTRPELTFDPSLVCIEPHRYNKPSRFIKAIDTFMTLKIALYGIYS